MTDLSSARYPQNSAWDVLLGANRNVVSSASPARSNLEWAFGNITDGAISATGISTSVAVPVDWGVVYSKVTFLAGATAEATGTHAFLAVYSGIATPALLAQSADNTGAAAVAASAAFTQTLQTAQQATPANAPAGFWYATICVTATTIPTLACMATPTAVFYQWLTGAPLGVALTHGSAQNGTAAATITGQSAFARAPIVILT